MKTLYLLVVIYIALILTGCNSTVMPSSTIIDPSDSPPCHHHKDPVNVAFLNNKVPPHPYKVLGQATVSRFNEVGIKRQNATIHDLIRQQAASLDGDAIIDIKNNGKIITATVIGYRKRFA